MDACQNGQIDIVRMLILEFDANIDIRDKVTVVSFLLDVSLFSSVYWCVLKWVVLFAVLVVLRYAVFVVLRYTVFVVLRYAVFVVIATPSDYCCSDCQTVCGC